MLVFATSFFLNEVENWWSLRYMQRVDVKDKKNRTSGRILSATFADLPAPELKWEEMQPAPVPRLDGASIQIKNLLYVFAGYGTLDYVRIFYKLWTGFDWTGSNHLQIYHFCYLLLLS